MEIAGTREYTIELTLQLNQEEASALMALVQNPMHEHETATVAAMRETLFNKLYNLGART